MKVAILGLGSIGRRHLQNFRTVGVDTLTAYDASAAQRDSAAAQFPFARVVASPEAAVDGADGVAICTPPDSHVTLARLGAALGAHLMIEKPFAVSASGVDDLLRFCESRGRRVLVAHNWRYWPPMHLVERFLREGRIGRVRAART